MEDFQKRMLEEHGQLVERLSKLNAALEKDGFLQKVGEKQFILILKQRIGMISYLEALEDRMKDMNINANYVNYSTSEE
jgi:hypothetical protein